MKRFPGSPNDALRSRTRGRGSRRRERTRTLPPAPHGGMMAWGHHQMEKCLSTLDLSDAQKAAIDEARAAGKATLKADGEAMKAVHQKMQADLAAGADKSVLGQNAIDQDAANTKMKADAKAIHEQVLGQLSNDQLDQYNAVRLGRQGAARAPGSPGRPVTRSSLAFGPGLPTRPGPLFYSSAISPFASWQARSTAERTKIVVEGGALLEAVAGEDLLLGREVHALLRLLDRGALLHLRLDLPAHLGEQRRDFLRVAPVVHDRTVPRNDHRRAGRHEDVERRDPRGRVAAVAVRGRADEQVSGHRDASRRERRRRCRPPCCPCRETRCGPRACRGGCAARGRRSGPGSPRRRPRAPPIRAGCRPPGSRGSASTLPTSPSRRGACPWRRRPGGIRRSPGRSRRGLSGTAPASRRSCGA